MLKNVLGTGGMESSDKAGGYSNSIDKKRWGMNCASGSKDAREPRFILKVHLMRISIHLDMV